MTLRPEYALGHSEYNAFLFAAVGEEKVGTLTVLTALTRLGIDPWQEAARLSDRERLRGDSHATGARRQSDVDRDAEIDRPILFTFIAFSDRNPIVVAYGGPVASCAGAHADLDVTAGNRNGCTGWRNRIRTALHGACLLHRKGLSGDGHSAGSGARRSVGIDPELHGPVALAAIA